MFENISSYLVIIVIIIISVLVLGYILVFKDEKFVVPCESCSRCSPNIKMQL